MPEERIQKVLAAAGVASRRGSEALVAAGRVRVNGRPAVIGEQVDPARAEIEVDGIPVGIGAARTYVALHKPAGVTSTTRDRHAETTVLDLIPTALVPDGTRIYPVGRLDLDSEGLLLLTNDGEWADHVLHPRFGVQREYAVALERPLEHEQAALIRAGIMLEEGLATLAAPLRPATAVETRTLEDLLHPPAPDSLAWYRAVLAQGWKRQLRRMFAATGAPIVRLVRVRIGTVRLDRLPTGRSRLLRAPEIRQLGAASTDPGRPKTMGPKGTGSNDPGTKAPGPARGLRAPQAAPAKRPSTPRVKGAPGSTGPRRPAPKTALTDEAALAKKQPTPAGTRPGRRRTKAAPGPSAPFRHGGRARGKTQD